MKAVAFNGSPRKLGNTYDMILKRTREAEPTSWFHFRERARGRKNPYPVHWGGMGSLVTPGPGLALGYDTFHYESF
jgi:hypothetical protein